MRRVRTRLVEANGERIALLYACVTSCVLALARVCVSINAGTCTAQEVCISLFLPPPFARPPRFPPNTHLHTHPQIALLDLQAVVPPALLLPALPLLGHAHLFLTVVDVVCGRGKDVCMSTCRHVQGERGCMMMAIEIEQGRIDTHSSTMVTERKQGRVDYTPISQPIPAQPTCGRRPRRPAPTCGAPPPGGAIRLAMDEKGQTHHMKKDNNGVIRGNGRQPRNPKHNTDTRVSRWGLTPLLLPLNQRRE